MTKKEFTEKYAEKTNCTKTEAVAALQAFEDVITEALASGEEISLLGFGTFKVTERAARAGRNPKTGEAITIEASKQVQFKAGSKLKEAVK